MNDHYTNNTRMADVCCEQHVGLQRASAGMVYNSAKWQQRLPSYKHQHEISNPHMRAHAPSCISVSVTIPCTQPTHLKNLPIKYCATVWASTQEAAGVVLSHLATASPVSNTEYSRRVGSSIISRMWPQPWYSALTRLDIHNAASASFSGACSNQREAAVKE